MEGNSKIGLPFLIEEAVYMFKTKETTPYLLVNFYIWLLEKFCGRTLKRNSIKIATQPYEKEEMVFTNTHYFTFLGRKIIGNVAVVVSIVVILIVLLLFYSTHYNFLSILISFPILVLLIWFLDIFLPECIRNRVNSLLAKEWKKFQSTCKEALDEQKNKN